MFFVRQKGNQCGLHAIHNLFKSAAVTTTDMHDSCQRIHDTTGDKISNHESFGGDWSVEAVVETVVAAHAPVPLDEGHVACLCLWAIFRPVAVSSG